MADYYVYILSNRYHTVLYTGVTNDLEGRIWQHANKAERGFTARNNCYKLLYYEVYRNPSDAIKREKQIKGYTRCKKVALITDQNPGWVNFTEKWERGKYPIFSVNDAPHATKLPLTPIRDRAPDHPGPQTATTGDAQCKKQ